MAVNFAQDSAGHAGTKRPPVLRARFAPAASVPRSSLSSLVPVPPTFAGKLEPLRRGESRSPALAAPEQTGAESTLVPEASPPMASPPSVKAGTDIFLADGSETALAIDVSNANILAGALNQGYLNTPSLLNSSNGNVSWVPNVFPSGAGTITGQTFDPWGSPGNSPGDLFTSLIRRDSIAASKVTHMILAHSGDSGVSWSRLFEVNKALVQDRDMFDVDRTATRGGGTGAAHDGKLYLTYDGFSTATQEAYVASYLQVVSPTGAALTEVTTSLPPGSGFNGTQMQPVAGTLDGQVYLMSVAAAKTDASVTYLLFHEVTGAGTGFTALKSGLVFPAAGQQLATSGRWGLNGHRIDTGGQMDIDRSSGPRRGNLYVLSSRNLHSADPTQDQGDIWLSISTDGAVTWNEAMIPGLAAGKTQFFAMLDVDDDGWIHVAYYQNETGLTDNGVLNASTANLYYTVSSDGGLTWSPHTRVNGSGDTLLYFDPPRDLSAHDYYLIGDYDQVRAGRAGGIKVAYVLWSGYYKYRTDIFQDHGDYAICTKMTPALDSDGDGLFDPQDNCPTIYNPGQEDFNNNGIGDICECLLTRANVDNTGSSLNRIDGSDLFPLARAFGSCSGDAAYNASTDLSPQGCVDGYDLAILASLWAESVPVTCP